VGQLDEERLAAVCAGVHDATTAARIAERILDVAKRPIGPGGLPVVPSIGATCGGRRPAPSPPRFSRPPFRSPTRSAAAAGNDFAVV
jgi:hypothetical protein